MLRFLKTCDMANDMANLFDAIRRETRIIPGRETQKRASGHRVREVFMKARQVSSAALVVWLLALMLTATSTVAFSLSPFPKAEGVDVASMVSDPFAYKGEVKVRGGVMQVNPARKLFSIIDYREYRACRSVTCAREWVTVLFEGKPPAVASVVEITGLIEKNRAGNGGFVLRAKAVVVK